MKLAKGRYQKQILDALNRGSMVHPPERVWRGKDFRHLTSYTHSFNALIACMRAAGYQIARGWAGFDSEENAYYFVVEKPADLFGLNNARPGGR